MSKLSSVLVTLLHVGQLQAALQMNDQKVIDVTISQRGLTRLSVKNDLIQDIFVYPLMIDEASVQESLQLHKSGHVFIAPEGITKPFYVTVMTQKGRVQDLKVMPGSHPSGPLILTLPPPAVDPQEAIQVRRQRFNMALLAAVQGIQPPGFQRISFTSPSEAKTQGQIQKTLTDVYQQPGYRLQVYELENTGEREIFLTPALFLSPSDLAVVFDQPSLSSHSKVRMAILRQVSSPPRQIPPKASISLRQTSSE